MSGYNRAVSGCLKLSRQLKRKTKFLSGKLADKTHELSPAEHLDLLSKLSDQYKQALQGAMNLRAATLKKVKSG